MALSSHPASREQRLAARLRDNLKRRKAQARARAGADVDASPCDPLPDASADNGVEGGRDAQAPASAEKITPERTLPKREKGG